MLVGAKVGGYVIERMLGEGGMGSVWLARNAVTEQLAAVKVIKHEVVTSRQAAQRFLREAMAGAKVQHPNIVRIYDVAQLDDGRPYILMEYLEGGDLDRYLQSFGKLGAEDMLRILGQIASALEALHEAGIVHRDLKPENVILTEGEARWVKVVDFGLAKVELPGRSRLTHAGMIAGTLGYMAPDQATGLAHVDGRADVYALGMIAMRMATGRIPFVRDTPDDNILAILERARENPHEARHLLQTEAAHLPPGCVEPILRAIAFRPEHRLQHARDLPIELMAAIDRGENILRSVAPRFWEHAPPDAATVKNRDARSGVQASSTPAPSARATVSTLGGAAGAVRTVANPRGRPVAIGAAIAAAAAVAAVAVLLAVRGGGERERTEPPAEPDPAAVAVAERDVWILTEPLRATVYADGERLGVSPVRLRRVVGAEVRVRAELDGHEPAEQLVRVAADADEITVTLAAAAPPPAVDAGAPTAAEPRRRDDRRRDRDARTTSPPIDAGAKAAAPADAAGPQDRSPKPFDPNAPIGPR